MRRTTPLTAATVLGLALALPAPSTAAHAVGETCRGEAATFVGTGDALTGTEGRDVIVTGPATRVDALGGNDLVCVTGPARSNVLSVVAGAGDDLVDTTALGGGNYVTTVLGAGADTYVGGRAGDRAYAGEQMRTPDGGHAGGADIDKDVIDTGEGNDSVITGAVGTPNRDVVTLGLGADHLSLGASTVTTEAVFDGGAGEDGLRLTGGSGDLTLDMAAGTFTSHAGTARFTSFEFSTLDVGAGTVIYRGTGGDDDLTVHPTDGAPTLDLATGGGDDKVTLEPAALAPASRIDTGGGQDALVAATEIGRLALDLPSQRLTVGAVDAVTTGLEDAFLMAPQVIMVGDDGDNHFSWTGCDADLRGGLGDDFLRWQYDYVFESYEFDCTGEVSTDGGDGRDSVRGSASDDLLIGGRGSDLIEGRGGDDRVRGGSGDDKIDGGEGRDDVRGGAGDDVLDGRAAADVLLGGRGRDRADGSTGRDRCVAESKARCER